MQNIITALIADFHERQLPETVRRSAVSKPLAGKARTAIGMRRAGKTWFLYQIMADLLNQSIPKEALLYINFEDERLALLKSSDLNLIIEKYYQLYPEKKEQTCYFFFDEIQVIDGWEPFVRRILDTENVRLFITGSSAKMLSKEISSSLRGRSLTTEIFPYTFAEALRAHGIAAEFKQTPGSRQRAQIKNHFQKFLLGGGFPEVQHYERPDRISALQEYVRSVIYRDIVDRHQIRSLQPLKRLIASALNAPATLFSVNKFYNHLKSQRVPCRKDTLYAYLDFLHDAYLLFPVRLAHRSEKARQVNPAKIYVIDTGLAYAHSRQPQPNWGHLLENFVFLELRKRGFRVEYYKTAAGNEVDFIVTDPLSGKQEIMQVSADINDEATQRREVRALEQAMQELQTHKSLLITTDETKDIETEKGFVQAVPAWLWALQLDKQFEQNIANVYQLPDMPELFNGN